MSLPRRNHVTVGMSAALLALLLIAGVLPAMAEPPGILHGRIVAEARSARERQDYRAYLDAVRRLVALMPGHPASHYSLARGLALAGDDAGAIQALRQLAERGFGYDPASDPAFESLRADPEFAAVTALLRARAAARGEPAGSIDLGLQGQQPEGVATTADGALLIGTLNGTVYRFEPRPDRTPRPLASVGMAVVGVRPDEEGDTFLACAADEAGGRTQVERRRLTDGALIATYPLPSRNGFCNDIALVDGGFAVTDSNTGAVFRLREGRLVRLPIPPLLFPNGIAFDPASGRLFVAHGNGVLSIDPDTGESVPLTTDGTLLGGIDGMAWHEGGLIAVQNVVVPPRLLRIVAGPGGAARVEPILSGHPQLAGATTVAVRAGEAIVLSQTGIPNGTPPDAPILLRVPL